MYDSVKRLEPTFSVSTSAACAAAPMPSARASTTRARPHSAIAGLRSEVALAGIVVQHAKRPASRRAFGVDPVPQAAEPADRRPRRPVRRAAASVLELDLAVLSPE